MFWLLEVRSSLGFRIRERLEQEKTYILADPEIYSIEDLVSVRNGDMKLRLKYLVELCCRHTAECKVRYPFV